MLSSWAAKFFIHLSKESSSSWYNLSNNSEWYRHEGELLWRQWDYTVHKFHMGDGKWERIELQFHRLTGFFLEISSDIFKDLGDNVYFSSPTKLVLWN